MFDLHDNEIISYEVNFRNRSMIIRTSYYDSKIADIYFEGVLAHSFKNEMPYSTILEFKECDINFFTEDYKNLLEDEISLDWTMDYRTIEELKEKLLEDKYRYYTITPSYGLRGWILAKKAEIK